MRQDPETQTLVPLLVQLLAALAQANVLRQVPAGQLCVCG